MVMRHPSVHDGQHQRWNVSLLWALCVDLVEARAGASPALSTSDAECKRWLTVPGALADPAEQARLVHAYNRFVGLIEAHELHVRAFDPPLLDVRPCLSFPLARARRLVARCR